MFHSFVDDRGEKCDAVSFRLGFLNSFSISISTIELTVQRCEIREMETSSPVVVRIGINDVSV